MDNILYKAFGKRIYKALLNLVGGGGGGSDTSGDVKTLAFDIIGDHDDLLFVRSSDKAIFTSISQEAMDALADNPEVLNYVQELIATNKRISDFIVECINNNKIPQVYYRLHTDDNNHAILDWMQLLYEAIRYQSSSQPTAAKGIALTDKSNDNTYAVVSGTYEGDKFITNDVPLTLQDRG